MALTALIGVSCKKKGSGNSADEAYCVYVMDGNNKVLKSCEKTQSDAAAKCQQLRNSGSVGTSSEKKGKCSEC